MVVISSYKIPQNTVWYIFRLTLWNGTVSIHSTVSDKDLLPSIRQLPTKQTHHFIYLTAVITSLAASYFQNNSNSFTSMHSSIDQQLTHFIPL